MKLGLSLGYWGSNPPTQHIQMAQQAEQLGYDSVWTAEAYGSDALTPLAWIG
ncbi:MAG: LLM class flavin-dependent oxidoreductase, partial [Pseudomonadota bacterium]|nr:LLM class flavin-dependent oxidoreductase [Pseudomonadota bacterium]